MSVCGKSEGGSCCRFSKRFANKGQSESRNSSSTTILWQQHGPAYRQLSEFNYGIIENAQSWNSPHTPEVHKVRKGKGMRMKGLVVLVVQQSITLCYTHPNAEWTISFRQREGNGIYLDMSYFSICKVRKQIYSTSGALHMSEGVLNHAMSIYLV